jgi:hypothetical protein
MNGLMAPVGGRGSAPGWGRGWRPAVPRAPHQLLLLRLTGAGDYLLRLGQAPGGAGAGARPGSSRSKERI